MKGPLAIDLYCGLGGWTEGLLAEGYRVVGFDIERHVYGDHHYPAQLVLQDALTIHGKQFKDVALIVASPPCQEYSYMAMPWSKAKQKIRDYESGVRDVKQLTALFDACFRIQKEASEAAGHHIPMVIENVRGAQRWVGRSRWNFGSFHLWGDVPALMPMVLNKAVKAQGQDWNRFKQTGEVSPDWKMQGDGIKHGGDCFNDPTWHGKQGGVKQPGISGVRDNGKGDRWFQDGAAKSGSKSKSRKYASAMIAKIPFVLSSHIAAVYKPVQEVA